MFKYKNILLFYPFHSCLTILVGDFIQLPKRNSVQDKFTNTMNKVFF